MSASRMDVSPRAARAGVLATAQRAAVDGSAAAGVAVVAGCVGGAAIGQLPRDDEDEADQRSDGQGQKGGAHLLILQAVRSETPNRRPIER
jgi:hypothetical protein